METYLKNERNRLGITQAEVSKLINISKTTYVRWEAGSPIPSDKLALLEGVVGFDIRYIVTGQRSFTDDFDFAIQKRAIDIVAKYIQRSDKELIHPELLYPVAMEIYQVIKQAEDSGQEADPIDMGTKIIPLFAA